MYDGALSVSSRVVSNCTQNMSSFRTTLTIDEPALCSSTLLQEMCVAHACLHTYTFFYHLVQNWSVYTSTPQQGQPHPQLAVVTTQ